MFLYVLWLGHLFLSSVCTVLTYTQTHIWRQSYSGCFIFPNSGQRKNDLAPTPSLIPPALFHGLFYRAYCKRRNLKIRHIQILKWSYKKRNLSKTNCGITVLWIDHYCGKLSRYFSLVVCSSEREWTWLVVSARRVKSRYWEHNSFLAGVLQWWHCRAWTWPPRLPDLKLPDFYAWVFLKERIYSHN